MSSFVTSPERSVGGKITRSGLDTRRSRPPASTIVASDSAIPLTPAYIGAVQVQQNHGQVVLERLGAVRKQLGDAEPATAPERATLRQPIREQHDRRLRGEFHSPNGPVGSPSQSQRRTVNR